MDGIGLNEIAVETLTRHQKAYAKAVPDEGAVSVALDDPGFYRFRRQGEQHAITPPVIKSFHAFVKSNKPEDYKAYVDAVKSGRPNALRDLLEITPAGRQSNRMLQIGRAHV